jgi:ParB-like chromosome segregation protein Spo0J
LTRKATTVTILPDLEPLCVPIGNVSPLPGNPRKGDVKAIREAIKKFGVHKPIVVRQTGINEKGEKTGTVLAGNHTLVALRSMPTDRVPVVWVDDDENTARGRALADNRVGELGDMDNDLLVEMLSFVTDDPDLFAATGYTQADIDKLLDAGEADMPGGDETGQIHDAWAVLVTCESEDQQVEILERLQAEGLTVRAMVS